ncbi:MAG: DNA gyrase inhibitor YacG [Yoonia sp.]
MACPICDRPVDPKVKPFCSKRCADVDLAKWLSGSYAIPSDNPEEAEELYQELSRAENKPH